MAFLRWWWRDSPAIFNAIMGAALGGLSLALGMPWVAFVTLTIAVIWAAVDGIVMWRRWQAGERERRR